MQPLTEGHQGVNFRYYNPYSDQDSVVYYARRFYEKYLKRLVQCERWLQALNPEQYSQYLTGNNFNQNHLPPPPPSASEILVQVATGNRGGTEVDQAISKIDEEITNLYLKKTELLEQLADM